MFKSIFLFALLVGFAAGQEPPPFGTVIEQWNLPMSGRYAGAGITWVRDSGKFYLVEQGYSEPAKVWKLDPADPPATIESVPWTVANLGRSTLDVPWGIAWDGDSGCFWVSQLVDGDIYAGYLLRHVWNGSRWVWGGMPRDSWFINDTTDRMYWIAGMEKWHARGYFACAPIATGPETLGVYFLDPYTKTMLGGLQTGEDRQRGLTLIPWDSCYVLTCGWNLDQFRKLDSLGRLLQYAEAQCRPLDWALHVPQTIRPDDTVCAYCITSHEDNCLQRISTGMLWSQLGSVAVEDERPTSHNRPPTATVCRGSLVLPWTLEPWTPWTLVSISGRKVMDLKPGENDIRHLSPGVYFAARPSALERAAASVVKVIVTR